MNPNTSKIHQRDIILVLFFFFSLNVLSSNPTPDPYGPKLYYFVIDRTLLLRDFGSNAGMLDALDALLNDSAVYMRIDSIFVTGAASPVGSRSHNDRLSLERAEAVKTYIMWKHPGFDRSRISTSVVGIDWEGFRALVAADRNIPSRDKVQELIALRLPEATLLQRLRTVGGRSTFDYLVKKVYPRQQYASVRIRLTDGSYIPPDGSSPLKQLVEKTVHDTVKVVVEKTVPVIVRDTVVSIVRDTVWIACAEEKLPVLPVEKKEEKGNGYYFGIKTNLLYDAALLPNLSVEFPFGKHWSVVLEGNESWWTFGRPALSHHRIQAAGLELRRWFASPAPLTGHAVGLYALGGTYDLRLFHKNNDSRGWLSNGSYSYGLSYAYSFPIARRFHIEFGLAAGYFGGRYYDYKFCIDNGHERWEWTAIRNRHYWGITRAEVSLVWLIGRKGVKDIKDFKDLNEKGGAQ